MGMFKTRSTDDNDFEIAEDEIRIDLAEDDDYYYIYADVPGKSTSDIKMKFKGDKLSIRLAAEDPEANPIANKSCIIQERIHDEVERLIAFDDPVDKKKTDARLEDGVLIVSIKKINPDFDDDEDLIIIKQKEKQRIDGANQNTEWWKYENMTKYEKIGAIKASIGLINDWIIPLSDALKSLDITEETY